MTQTKLSKLEDLLSQGKIGQIIDQAKESMLFTERVRSLLPEEIQPHLISAEHSDQGLVLVTDASVWTARLRYLGPELLDQCSKELGLSSHKILAKTAIRQQASPDSA